MMRGGSERLELMSSQDLRRFLAAVPLDPALQEACRGVRRLEDLIAVMARAGYGVTPLDLQLWAHDAAFSSPWWPWAGQGKARQIAFFREQPLPE